MAWKCAGIRFFIFAFGGMLGEVFLGAFRTGWSGNWSIHGQSSPWMMIDYGLMGIVLMPMAKRLIRLGMPLPARAFVYMLVIYFVEYVSGIIFTWGLGLRVWSYEGIPYNLHGQIMLYSAPVWYLLGFCGEYLYGKADAIAVLLLRGITAEQLESARFPESGNTPV
jgi:uncharacterized membrane protein